MKLTLTEEKFEFDFPNAKALYKFDERDPLSPTFHGVSMQAVDVVAEFQEFQLWIEIKEFQPSEIEAMRNEGDQQKKGDNVHNKAHLTKNLKHKFRDTFLYRFCENKLDTRIVYVCLTNFDDALNVFYKKELQKQLPTGLASKRWSKYLLDKSLLMVVNKESWKRNLEVKFGKCYKI
ncbi:MAG: hypothetical protein MJZ24_00865 [Paludibacteraceae bacterium]|nr:hypothetical protein [Paludibacteraceae bacterium]